MCLNLSNMNIFQIIWSQGNTLRYKQQLWGKHTQCHKAQRSHPIAMHLAHTLHHNLHQKFKSREKENPKGRRLSDIKEYAAPRVYDYRNPTLSPRPPTPFVVMKWQLLTSWLIVLDKLWNLNHVDASVFTSLSSNSPDSCHQESAVGNKCMYMWPRSLRMGKSEGTGWVTLLPWGLLVENLPCALKIIRLRGSSFPFSGGVIFLSCTNMEFWQWVNTFRAQCRAFDKYINISFKFKSYKIRIQITF